MAPTLSLELIYLCIEAGRDFLPTLLKFSLVSKGCSREAKKYLFEKIRLNRKKEGEAPGPEYQSRRIRGLFEILTSSKAVATSVRALDIKLEPMLNETDTYIKDLPSVLDLLPGVKSLSINAPDNAPRQNWDTLPNTLKSSVARICSTSSIANLDFSNFSNFPEDLLMLSTQISSLSLAQIEGPVGTKSERVVPSGRVPSPRLSSLTTYNLPLVVWNCLLRNPEWLCSLKEISWFGWTPQDFDTFCCVIRHCAPALKELVIAVLLPWQDPTNNSFHFEDMAIIPLPENVCLISYAPSAQQLGGNIDPLGTHPHLLLAKYVAVPTQH
ncbi:hypothetical protein D9611_014355 [Ephemerocybe angulata]|uniref:Uncharacterized protein n=1 Tax=Ephemerocybe angulata TaxID=980116 RepID=A0A8H5B9X0_9AGAR|nr:hypothetical protein D9611_014355 [Tulosesus angulatus]